MGQGFPGGEERDVCGGQVGAQGCGEVFCLTVGGGDDEAERFGGGCAYAAWVPATAPMRVRALRSVGCAEAAVRIAAQLLSWLRVFRRGCRGASRGCAVAFRVVLTGSPESGVFACGG